MMVKVLYDTVSAIRVDRTYVLNVVRSGGVPAALILL